LLTALDAARFCAFEMCASLNNALTWVMFLEALETFQIKPGPH